jgi:uncharacterized protein (DUF1697 family)
MAHVVLLRGINVGGHRTFRPAKLAAQLKDLDVVNIGAAGTFVVRRGISRDDLRKEFAQRLPFDAHIMICSGRDVAKLTSRDFFAGYPVRPDIIRFASVLSRRPRARPTMPLQLPERGPWLVKVLAIEGRFLVGVYRRQMRAIGCLGRLDDVFGAAATTRNWNTISAIASSLGRVD